VRLPKTLTIFGAEVLIIKVKDLTDEQENKVDGLFLIECNIIKIEADLSDEDTIHTLLHELFHAMIVRNSINQTTLSHDVEEILADTNATMITELFNLRFKRKKS